MPGRTNYMSVLESRRQELLAQSEVNRIELFKDWDAVKAESKRVKKQVRTAGSIASSAAILAAAAAILRRRHHEPPKAENHEKAPWLATALNGARMGASLFFKVRSLMRERR
ncbi:MAG: hypothetical protein ACRED1_05595 [Limisphaerales bacterium]